MWQNLTSLDVSVNGLNSTRLGIHAQLRSLEQLSLSGNKIFTLQKDDFSWLNQSSVRVLRMASLPLREVSVAPIVHTHTSSDMMVQ